MANEQLVGNIKGPKGDKPNHQWAGTQIRFELPNSEWGPWIDTQGAPGKDFEYSHIFSSVAEMNAALSQAQAGDFAIIQTLQGAADDENAQVYTVKVVDSAKQWVFIGDFSGATGPTPNITVSAASVPAGSVASVAKSGTNENPHFSFNIPSGQRGKGIVSARVTPDGDFFLTFED